MITDDHIVEGCLAGKRKAYDQLYRKYAASMLGLCLRYCGNLQDAEDVLQEGFIKVFRNISNFRRAGSFEGWIKRIMVNSAIDHYQKELKHSFHAEIDQDMGLPEESTEESLLNEYQFTQEQLLKMVQELPQGYRMVFNMYVMEGFNHRDIADTLQISENTSKTQLMKSRRMLKSRLLQLISKEEMRVIVK
jgi:RNA polymerase sigma-70 factor (ECF subfamily)